MPVIICAKCGHTNLHGALYCEECFSPLLDTLPVSAQTSSIGAQTSGAAPPTFDTRRVQRVAHAQTLHGHCVALYIGDPSELLISVVAHSIILGRVQLSDLTQLCLDLSPYGALAKGVSREHVILRRVQNRLLIEDVGSSNGTWLNGERLQPHQAAPIASGARLQLGQLELEIYLPD